MSTATRTPTRQQTDQTWLRVVRASVAVGIVSLGVFAYVGTFQATVSDGGDFRYAADYWYTAVGLPLALVGIGLTLGIHKLQHRADGRLGSIGVWINAVALSALFIQLSASLLASAEEQWGPSYIVCTFLTFLGTALLAAGSWRTGMVPKWMLGVWPVLWVLGTFAAQGLTPLLLAAFLIALGTHLTRRLNQRTPAQSSR